MDWAIDASYASSIPILASSIAEVYPSTISDTTPESFSSISVSNVNTASSISAENSSLIRFSIEAIDSFRASTLAFIDAT